MEVRTPATKLLAAIPRGVATWGVEPRQGNAPDGWRLGSYPSNQTAGCNSQGWLGGAPQSRRKGCRVVGKCGAKVPDTIMGPPIIFLRGYHVHLLETPRNIHPIQAYSQWIPQPSNGYTFPNTAPLPPQLNILLLQYLRTYCYSTSTLTLNRSCNASTVRLHPLTNPQPRTLPLTSTELRTRRPVTAVGGAHDGAPR